MINTFTFFQNLKKSIRWEKFVCALIIYRPVVKTIVAKFPRRTKEQKLSHELTLNKPIELTQD